MKYYKLKNTIKIKEIGKYPQCLNPKFRGNINSLGFNNEVINSISLPTLIIHPKGKSTTYLHGLINDSLRFLVLKNYFIEFLQKFNIGEHQFWNIEVEHNKKILTDYSLFHSPFTLQKEINFLQSELLIGKLGDWKAGRNCDKKLIYETLTINIINTFNSNKL